MKETTSPLAANLAGLRKCHQYSQEEVAEKIGVTRQAVAKWESGETMPDILNCDALAALYGVSLDDLVHHEGEKAGYPIPPKGKHMFGTVTVGERGADCAAEEGAGSVSNPGGGFPDGAGKRGAGELRAGAGEQRALYAGHRKRAAAFPRGR